MLILLIIMNKVKFLPILFIIAACTTAPSLINYFVSPGIMQYFIPPTDWNAHDSRAKAQLDITYRNEAGIPAIINITFIGENSMPREAVSVSLNGDGVNYPLNIITVIYRDSRKRELRISAEGDPNSLITLLEAESITLSAEIDGLEYTYTPGKHFITLKNDFLDVIIY